MKLSTVDLSIILLYLFSTVIIGVVLKKRAQKSKSSYLLGGNKLPWYMLGLSNASGMFDISGTMFNILVGIICQTSLVALPIFIVTKQSSSLLVTIGVILVTGLILKNTWWDRLEE